MIDGTASGLCFIYLTYGPRKESWENSSKGRNIYSMLRKSTKRVKHGCTKWRKKSGKGFPFPIPIKIKMTSSNEAERWNEFFNQLHALVDSIKNRRTGDEDLTYLHQHLGDSITTLHYLVNAYYFLEDDLTTINKLIRNLRIMYVDLFRDMMKANIDLAYLNLEPPPTEISRGPGRPKYIISEEKLVFLKQLGFTWKNIATVLLVSRWTIYRRINQLGLHEVTGCSNLTDEELDNIIIRFKQEHGISVGRSLVMGHLRSLGLRVQKRRITKALLRIDPRNSNLRWTSIIQRRKYSVPSANSLWHIDGHHSFINWGFVIHGAIDRFSRLIVDLHCSTNNRSDTVFNFFNEALEQYGVPSRIRADKGGENVLCWDGMVELRGEDRGSYITGSSVHNQRIERLWRDLWNAVACNF